MSSVDEQRSTESWWRSLEQLADTPRFRALLDAEFPAEADPGGISRRRWLQLMGASLALAGATGCRWQEQEIRPFAKRPDGRVPGKPRRFTTAMPLGDAAIGLEVTTVDGRPVKIEGNPRHPQSLGATDLLAQAALLELYDPDRSRNVCLRSGKEKGPRSWDEFLAAFRQQADRLHKAEGAGFCVLTEAHSSPTLDALHAEFLRSFPKARWFEFDPIGDDHQRAGAVLAFGRPLRTHLALDASQVVLCLDADPLGAHPAALRYARDFAAHRNATAGQMNRLYAVESSLSLTGAAADHRLALRSTEIPAFLAILESVVAGSGDLGEAPSEPVRRFVDAVAKDLLDNRGRGAVCIGPGQAAEAHAAVHRLNALLENVGEDRPVGYTRVPHPNRPSHTEAIKALADEIRAGRVGTLLILGGNPVYNAPADLAFGEALQAVETSVHLSLYRDETSRQCTWHLPRSHFLESWGDVCSYDGTYSVVQPMIAPLFGGRSPIEVLAVVLDAAREAKQPAAGPEELVRRTFCQEIAHDEGAAWRQTLRDGLLAESRWPWETVSAPGGPKLEATPAEGESKDGGLELVFCRDASVYDGRFANNGWLQELPDPLTRLVWDNAALLSPATAAELGIENETLMTIEVGDRQIRMPAWVMPGQARGSIAVSLGYGRTAAGHIGGDTADNVAAVGVDVYPLRGTSAMTVVTGVKVEPTGEPYRLGNTQDHHAIDTVGRRGRQQRLGSLIRQATLEHYRQHPDFAKHAVHHPDLKSLWREHAFAGHRWAMAIDLSRCIGCGACVVACQAENNIPIVGKQQVLRGRAMHWLRVDRYFRGREDAPEVAFQPLPCQQCELAPCEQVCPVAATVHSREGLNDMVYNRCVGTRYCANNCPYKVRRFNYLDFHKDLEDPDNEVAKMKYNPEVTVRSRGVMEKCTYCVQRIQAAKIEAKNAGRAIRDGEIRTACQQVCPTGAIVFGDLAEDEDGRESDVLKLHGSDRAYALLGELNIRPRTIYLARIRNPNPQLEATDPEHDGHPG
ncbi:MAG: TAT-variant-translocated molybdopterin oxidoreductase [Pirellulales bacterium]|nr:TAT-variant-translocated molybdopterin oxidoreductase [Pirellulales bacterium]